jgi:hypothetical protein
LPALEDGQIFCVPEHQDAIGHDGSAEELQGSRVSAMAEVDQDVATKHKGRGTLEKSSGQVVGNQVVLLKGDHLADRFVNDELVVDSTEISFAPKRFYLPERPFAIATCPCFFQKAGVYVRG